MKKVFFLPQSLRFFFTMMPYWYFKLSFYFLTTMPCTLLCYCAVYTHLWFFFDVCYMYVWFYDIICQELKQWNQYILSDKKNTLKIGRVHYTSYKEQYNKYTYWKLTLLLHRFLFPNHSWFIVHLSLTPTYGSFRDYIPHRMVQNWLALSNHPETWGCGLLLAWK